MKILIINGPNLNMLGIREPGIYGAKNYKALVKFIKDSCKEFGVKGTVFQSNSQGKIVTKIQKAYKKYDAIVINPAAYTHTSVAILDALKAVSIPAAEVHLSDVNQREEFRKFSYAGMACEAHFIGQGFEGYRQAIKYFVEKK